MQESVELEQTILGAILVDNSVMLRLDGLKPDYFSEPLHQRIFEEIQRRHARGDLIEPLSMKAKFDKDEALEATGSGKYFANLLHASIQTKSPEKLAQELKAIYARNRLLAHCMDTMNEVTTGDESAEELASKLASKLETLTNETARKYIKTAYEVGLEIIEDLNNQVYPTSTGIKDLDAAMGGGLFRNKAYGFAARKKVGKTILAATLSYNLSKQKVRHLFIAAEMGSKEIHERILSRHAGCFPSAFRSDYSGSQAFQEKLAKAVIDSGDSLLYWSAAGLKFHDLQQKLAIAVHKFKIEGFILDYWQLVGGKGKNASDASHLDEVAQWIADFCRKHNVWAVVMAQINQEGNTRGGEGIRLAFDQVYAIRGMGNNEDVTRPERWVQMLDTRYTKWANLGDKDIAGLYLNEKGLYFSDLPNDGNGV